MSSQNVPQNSPMDTAPSDTEVQALFNRIAPVYDELNDQLSFGLHRIWKRMAVKWTGVGSGDSVLDLCCGTGDLALLLAQTVGPDGDVTGVDFACDLLAIAAQRSTQAFTPASNIQWQQGDVLKLDFADNTFDGATMGYGLRNVVDIPQALRELHRVLKPGAKASILDMHRPPNDLLRNFQTWYLENLVVPSATRLGVREEYVYINPSIERFPVGPEQVAIARDAGFIEAVHYPLAGGMMGCLVIQK